MLLENQPLKWALVLKQGAGSRKQEKVGDVRVLQKSRSSCSKRLASFPLSHQAPPHSAAAPSQGVPRPSPAGVKIWLLPPDWTLGSLVVLEPDAPSDSCVPNSSEPPHLGEAQTPKSLTILVLAGREGFSKAGLRQAGSRAANRKVQGWVHTRPGRISAPSLTAHSGKGSPTPGSAPPVSLWQERGR